MKKLLFTLLFLTLGTAWGGALEDGQAAFDREDYATAIKLWRPLADTGNANAQANLGTMYNLGQGVTQDYKEAGKWLRLAAEQGNVNAQYNLGVMYRDGQGVPQDHKEAVKWLRLAAEQGDADAQSNLGYQYLKGHGVTQDHKEAVKWYRRAVEQGNVNAQNNLGLMYANGQGVTQDYKEAGKWLRLAAEQGNVNAQYNLGVMYRDGQGVPQDHKEAVKWLRLAAEQGDADAQSNLGVMYANGKGVLQDYVRAHMWYNLASSAGGSQDSTSTENRDKLAKKMTPQQIEKAQEMAKACQARSLKGCGMKPLSSDELLVNNLNISEAEFSKQFQCPEYLSNDRGRESAIDYMMQWLGANSRTPVTPVSLVAFRMKMLTEHHCETTLNNIHQNFNNDLQQENIKISQKNVSDVAKRFKGVMEESGISGVTVDVQKCYDDALSKSNEQELIRSCMLYDTAAKALDIGFGKAMVARVGKDPGPANAYLSNKAYKTRIEIYTKIAFKGYTDTQVINYFGDYPSKLIDRLSDDLP